ncbi:MAG TPA: PilZ domain-containing protein [Burkholderiales bacterium]|nr:PilZ domain-containing protein [Burkholderiales bacterium]
MRTRGDNGGTVAKTNLRIEPRVAQGRRGTLSASGTSTPCVIQDISTKGFLIMCTKPFAVGDVLELKSELYPGKFVTCSIEVRHVTDTCMGTRILDINPASLNVCRQFIEEHYSERLKFG